MQMQTSADDTKTELMTSSSENVKIKQRQRKNPSGDKGLIRRTCLWVQVLGYGAGQSASGRGRRHRKVLVALPALHTGAHMWLKGAVQSFLTFSSLYW